MRLTIILLLLGCLHSSQVLAKSKILEVPYSRQYRAFSCGHNSFRMLMGYWGVRLSRQRIIDNVGVSGTNGDMLNAYVKRKYSRDFNFLFVSNSVHSIKKEIDRGHPVIVDVDASYLSYLDYDTSSGHAILVTGYDDRKKVFYLRDPNTPYIESITFERIQKAWKGKKRGTYTVVKKDGRSVPKNQIKHFDKAKPFGAKKDHKGIPISWLVPSVHYVLQNDPEKNIDLGYARTKPKDRHHYFIFWNGLSYGDTTLENSPWLGNGQSYKMAAFNASYTLRGSRFRLGSGELVSPGVYNFGRHRTLDIHGFKATKRIPALNLNAFTVEASGFLKQENEEEKSYSTIDMSVTRWGGGYVGIRRGLGPVLGHASLGVTYAKAHINYLNSNDNQISATVPTTTFSATLGPLKGSMQSMSSDNAEDVSGRASNNFADTLEVEAHSLGFNLNLGGIRSSAAWLNMLNYTGIFGLHFEMTTEILRKTDTLDIQTYEAHKKWDVELPVALGFMDLAYGWSINRFETSQGHDTNRNVWVKFFYNNFLPFAQLQLGYRLTYANDEATGQELMLGIFAGLK